MADLSVKVDLGRVPKLIDSLRSNRGAKAGLQEAAEYMRKKAATPPPVRRKRQPPKTDRQRRFLHAAARAGKIKIPYPRSGGIGRDWQKEFRDNGMLAEIYNRNPKARGLHHPVYQWKYHSGNWSVLPQMISQHGPQVFKIVRTRIVASTKFS